MFKLKKIENGLNLGQEEDEKKKTTFLKRRRSKID